MTVVYRPSVLRALPILASCDLGVIPLAVDAPGIVKIAGSLMIFGGAAYLSLLLSTSFSFGPCHLDVTSLGRRRSFGEEDLVLNFYSFPSGFFGSNRAVEMIGRGGRISVALSMFRPADRNAIDERLNALAGSRN